MHILAQWIAAFRAENPLVQYDIYSATADEVKDRIEKGILDMGLLVEPVDVSKYEFIRIPCKERWGLLTQADPPLAAQDFVTPGDLVHIPLPIAKRSLVQEELRGWFVGSLKDQACSPAAARFFEHVQKCSERMAGDKI